MKDEFTKKWIIENSIEILKEYELGELTIRSLHYRLVSIGMHNTQQHYKRVVNAMIEARWNNDVLFETFKDHEREVLGETKYLTTSVQKEVKSTIYTIEYWMDNYYKNRWENQPNYVEVFIEKKALQGLFEPICNNWDVALNPCKGYPSLTFLNDAAKRFNEVKSKSNKNIMVLYFGDYDPSGEDIPRSIAVNFEKLGAYDINIKHVALNEKQVIEMNLPPAPTKETDTRSAKWDGLGQVELDAVDPKILKQMAENAILELFDDELYNELMETEEEEKEIYKSEIKNFIQNL